MYNREFITSHSDIIVDKKSDSPDEDKCAHESKLLILTLKDFFARHPLINSKTFLGDAAFDTVNIYELLPSGDTFGKHRYFTKADIPLNEHSKLKNPDFTLNDDGIPCCPHNPNLPMKPEGTAKTKVGLLRYKFVCPMIKWIYNPVTHKSHRNCCCDNSCTSSPCGRMVYIQQESDFRAYPGTIRGIDEWNNTYKKYELLLKEILITSKRISVLLIDVPKTKRPYMSI